MFFPPSFLLSWMFFFSVTSCIPTIFLSFQLNFFPPIFHFPPSFLSVPIFNSFLPYQQSSFLPSFTHRFLSFHPFLSSFQHANNLYFFPFFLNIFSFFLPLFFTTIFFLSFLPESSFLHQSIFSFLIHFYSLPPSSVPTIHSSLFPSFHTNSFFLSFLPFHHTNTLYFPLLTGLISLARVVGSLIFANLSKLNSHLCFSYDVHDRCKVRLCVCQPEGHDGGRGAIMEHHTPCQNRTQTHSHPWTRKCQSTHSYKHSMWEKCSCEWPREMKSEKIRKRGTIHFTKWHLWRKQEIWREKEKNVCCFIYIYIYLIFWLLIGLIKKKYRTSISNFKMQNISYDVNVCYLKARFWWQLLYFFVSVCPA